MIRGTAGLALVVAMVLSGVAVSPARGQGAPVSKVRVGEARQTQAQNRVDVIGRLEEVRRAVVASEQTGRVVAMEVDEGDRVEGGKTVLARIDDVWAQIELRTAEADLASAQAAVAEAQARLDNATRDREYLEQLEKRQSANPKEVADARALERVSAASLQSAQAMVLSAKAAVDRAGEAVQRLVIVAPFDGVVVNKMTEIGQWVERGSAIAQIISSGSIDAMIDVPESLINQLRIGQSVDVSISALNLEVDGQVVAINPMGSVTARTFPVKVRLSDVEAKLKPAMSVIAHVPSGEMVTVTTVPRDAVHLTASGPVVWMNLGGKAMSTPVRVLYGLGDRYAVRATGGGPPLTPGAQVVIEGAERLHPGADVQVLETAAAAPATGA